jgi:hypothetical protein
MTLREQADALFARAMQAGELGDEAQLRFFSPNTPDAYALLDSLDGDALYHIGRIDVVTGNLDGAREQRDALLERAPRHLLDLQLSYALSEAASDTTGMRKTLEQFLTAYQTELATGRPEYEDHAQTLEQLRRGAERVAAGKEADNR